MYTGSPKVDDRHIFSSAVLADGDAIQDDVSAAESVLLNSMLNLYFKADKNVFEAVLAEANAIDLSAYSEADLAAFNAAKSAAEAAYNDSNAEQDAADKAVSCLQAAIASLTGAQQILTHPHRATLPSPPQAATPRPEKQPPLLLQLLPFPSPAQLSSSPRSAAVKASPIQIQ